ncbi:ParB/RepB/Spo0J family partition protein [Actinoplanes sp. NPDC026670]|uniref:ParB/RepB/Spo0J family partition protein n=1 Tax=Actinoplanes sp. NPDC026670 TaxID=3154700 RepID=UPI00340603CD
MPNSSVVTDIPRLPPIESARHAEPGKLAGRLTGPVRRIPIAALRMANSPRTRGLDQDHVLALSDTGAPLPPIIVDRTTMRVIDGMHRLTAALRNGQEAISAVLVDSAGDDESFLLSVELNVAHGLPLTRADRRAAVEQIIRGFPAMSDRSIATIAGLTPKTVSAIRRTLGAAAQSSTRVGRDGRIRPTNYADGRRAAGLIVAARPEASLREIAREAGISVGTARDVRRRMSAGQDPVPNGCQPVAVSDRGDTSPDPAANRPDPVAASRTVLEVMRKDPALRYTESGRELLRWLGSRAAVVHELDEAATRVPPHCVPMVSKIAQACARAWASFADELEQQLAEYK